MRKYFRAKIQRLDYFKEPVIFHSEKTLKELLRDLSKTHHVFHLEELVDFVPVSKRWYDLELIIHDQKNKIRNATDTEIEEGVAEMWDSDLRQYEKIFKNLQDENWEEASRICKSLDTGPRERLPKNIWQLFEILRVWQK